MASTLVDLVKITAASTGTGAITLGAAVPGYRGIEALTNGKTYSYSIVQGSSWEFGRGTFLSATLQLVRSPIGSSDGGAAINLQQNSQVSFVPLAEDLDAVQLSVDAVAAAARTQSDATATASDRAFIEASAASIVYGQQVYPNAYASALPQGVTALSTAGVGTGTGGSAGTYPGGVSGGPTGFAWTYTISAGGAIESYAITNPGLASTGTAPTLSYPSGGITGATVPVATVGTLIEVAKSYWAASADSRSIALWQNDGTSTPAAVLNADTTQIEVFQRASADAASLLGRYYSTTAAGAAAVAVGELFTSDESGTLSIYKVIAGPAAQFYDNVPTSALINSKASSADLANTATGKGGSLVALEQGGTVQDAVKFVTPQTFGAKGDNSTDDWSSFAVAIAYCQVHNTKLVIPRENYVVSQQIVITSPIDIDMDPSANIRFTGASSAGILIDLRAASARYGLNVMNFGGLYSPSCSSAYIFPGYPASWSTASRSTQDAITLWGGSRINISVQYAIGWKTAFLPQGTYDVANGACAPLNVNFECNTADLCEYGVRFDGGPSTAASLGAIVARFNTCFAKYPVSFNASTHSVSQCNAFINGQAFTNEAGGALIHGEGANINTCTVKIAWGYAGYSSYDSPTGTSTTLSLPYISGDQASNSLTTDGNSTDGYFGGSNNTFHVGVAIDQAASPGGALPASGNCVRVRDVGANNKIDVGFYARTQGSAIALSTTQGEANYDGGVGAAAISRKIFVSLTVPTLSSPAASTFYFYSSLLSAGHSRPMRLVPVDGTMGASGLIFDVVDHSASVNREGKIEVTNLTGASVTGATYYCWIVLDD